MESSAVLDVIEALHHAADHPDIAQIRRYGRDAKPGGQSPAGVAIRYRSGSEAYIWAAAAGNKLPTPTDLPEVMPSLRVRNVHALRFLMQLLDAARPKTFTAWRTVAFPEIGLTEACGIELKGADGTNFYLRVTCGSGATDPAEDPHPDYTIPQR